MRCDQCLHVTFTMNQLYLVGGPVPLHCAFSSICNCVGSPQLLMVTLNQLYLVKGGPGIIALHSFLYLHVQSCRVTASGCCAAHSLLFVPLPKKYTPTCEGISYTKCSAAFAKISSMQPSPHPMCKPSTSAPLI
jgi:hypothetical protein